MDDTAWEPAHGRNSGRGTMDGIGVVSVATGTDAIDGAMVIPSIESPRSANAPG